MVLHKYIEAGDLVWYRSDSKQLHMTPKLRKPFEGPYVVVKCLNELDFLVQFDARGTRRVVHHNRLKPYEGQMKIKWAKSVVAKAGQELEPRVQSTN